ncbi:MAG: FAD:protein FMN transferase [Chloroflexota bacterium]
MNRVEHIMGMPIGIDVRDADVDPGALDRAFEWLRLVDAIFSTYKADSEISRLNRGEMTLDTVHSDVLEVLERCEELREETGGYFDIRASALPPEVPISSALSTESIDPSGFVKGWSIDRAAKIFDAEGIRNYSINAGGDIRVRGRAIPESCWRIGIQHPLQHGRVAAVVVSNDLAIATSGTYARGEHIIDPHTGRPAGGILSVTIVGPDLATADAYATAAYAMGEAGPAWTASLTKYEAMTILADEAVLSTQAFPSAREE